MSFALSILIPTHKRPDVLRRCLDCIAAQTILRRAQDDTVEVIVVSDGPDEATAEMVQGLRWPFELQYFALPKQQQGVCRNRAVEKARGKYCLLIGDDIFLASDACERHLQAHERLSEKNAKVELRSPNSRGDSHFAFRISHFGCAVLGYTTWDPSLKVTSLMKWMEKSGVQFGYGKIEKYAQGFIPKDMQHWFTYTSNLSLPKKILREHPFREDISLYGWEDIEWGLRLAHAGIRLFYEPDAKAYHHHTFTAEEIWSRSFNLGVSAVEMERLVPDLQLCPKGFKKFAYRLCSLLPTCRGRHCRAFLHGLETRVT